MDDLGKIKKVCKKYGYSDDKNIADFWFENESVLVPEMNSKKNGYSLPNDFKWQTTFGQAYQSAIRNFIKNKVDNNFDSFKHLQKDKNGDYITPTITYAVLDFRDFTFEYAGDDNNIKFRNKWFPSNPSSIFSLGGIDLSEMRLQYCIFRNCTMTGINFYKTGFHLVTFDNCELSNSSFRDARISVLYLINGSRIIAADFTGAFVQNVFGLGDKSIFHPFKYNEVSWFWLVKATFKSFLLKDYTPFSAPKKHTYFQSVDVSEITSSQLRSLKEYINWFQFVDTKITLLKKERWSKKLRFLFQIISTKYWNSFSVFALFALTINVMFTLIIYLNYGSFKNLNQDFNQCLYYSTVTFTTLGYGDISPQNTLGQYIVMVEVIVGYIILALFIYLISRKIEKSS